MNDRDLHEPLNIGHSNDAEIVKGMHRAEQRVVHFVVAFEELPPPPESRDYRLCLDRIWRPFLTEAGLSAGILNQWWHPDRGFLPIVIGHVWRQHGTERLGTVTESEVLHLRDLLLAHGSQVARFTLTDLITTNQFGKNHPQRNLCFRNGEVSIEPGSTRSEAPWNPEVLLPP